MASRRVRASALWGAVGAMAFLVLVQAYELAVGTPLGLAPKLGIAVTVGLAATGLTFLADAHLPAGERKR